MEQAAFAFFCPVRGAVRALLSGEKGRGFVRVEALARGGCGPLAALLCFALYQPPEYGRRYAKWKWKKRKTN